MDAGQVDAFEEFWRAVDRAEAHVRQYSHVGWHPGRRDGWDEPLDRAYEAVRPHLAPLRRPLLVATPAGARGFNPYRAETAHQALMFFLNPPEDLFGQAWVLSSPEYRRIKQDAVAELERLRPSPAGPDSPSRPVPPARRPARRSRKDTQAVRDAAVLKGHLAVHHFPLDGAPVLEPLSQKEIGLALAWRQDRVSRAMGVLFRGGMRAYKGLLRSGRLPAGFKRHYDDGTSDVEAIDEG